MVSLLSCIEVYLFRQISSKIDESKYSSYNIGGPSNNLEHDTMIQIYKYIVRRSFGALYNDIYQAFSGIDHASKHSPSRAGIELYLVWYDKNLPIIFTSAEPDRMLLLSLTVSGYLVEFGSTLLSNFITDKKPVYDQLVSIQAMVNQKTHLHASVQPRPIPPQRTSTKY
ncbi:hypothetical protein BDQ17DRAFT_1326733 [Cyathus striatus]|nr:hypothetical protein BDQ17DRAFT_1326733 [Cyathus striatus]